MQRRRFLQLSAQTAMAAWGASPLFAVEAPRRDVPWLSEVQRPPPSIPPGGPTLAPLLVDSHGRPITTREAWSTRREELRRTWLEFLGPLSAAHLARRPPATSPEWTVLEDETSDGVQRKLIRYTVEDDQPVEAYLLMPEGARSAPGVVVFHSTVPESIRQPAGVEGAPEKAFGWQLARRGCVTLSPRNYLWPENRRIDARGEAARFLARHPRSKGMDRMLLDGLIAVDLLAALPQVDPQRIGCVGHSLGAKEALYLAAFDERVRATVSSEGGIGTTFSNWHDPWYLGEAMRQGDFAREHHELLALIAPRAFLLIGGDSADGDQSWPFIAAALEVYRLYDSPPRLGLLNHKQGHSVPPLAGERILEWLDAYL